MANQFGAALRTLRNDLGLSQLALAGAISTTQRHISFLETGRSQPTRDFVTRLSTQLAISLPHRALLFDAAGFQNPYRHDYLDEGGLEQLLDMLEARALRHWPFPGFVLDREWFILRANAPGWQMLADFRPVDGGALSMFEVFVSDTFRSRLENWEDVSLVIYLRMQIAATHSPHLAELLRSSRTLGIFDHIPDRLTAPQDVPAYVPAILRRPDGGRLIMSSFVGQLASVHDAAIAGLDIEFLMPMDEETEACLMDHRDI